jgi:hypothetical protein
MFIHGGFEGTLHREHTWNLILRFSKNMKELQHLRLSREGFGLHLQHITPYMARFPELRRLSVHGITEAEKMQKSDLESRTRTSPITELSLSDYEEGRIATRALIAWPKTLTHFTFGSFYNNKHTMDYTDFESWLSIHNLTLKSVDIGYLSGSGSSRLFNAMPFPNLESLKLSRWQQGWPHRTDPLRFKAEDANVLGQRVKFFGWDFGIYDQHSESWNAFGEDEEVWLTSLAKIAAAKKAALRTIKIYFRPDSYEVTEENGYPWDRMDRIRDKACKNNGIELEYTPPTITKENWLDALDPETRREDGRMTDRSDEHWSEPGEGSPAWREDEAEVLVQAETHLAKIEIPEHYGRDIREYFPRVQHPEA